MKELLVFPVVKPNKNKLDEAYEVAKDFLVTYENNDIWVPKFFQYDGASIPSIAWQIIGTPFNPKFMKAAVVHDWLYHTHQIEKKAADELFYILLIKNGVNKVKAILMKEAVENFGGWYWENDSDDKEYIKMLKDKIIKAEGSSSKYGI